MKKSWYEPYFKVFNISTNQIFLMKFFYILSMPLAYLLVRMKVTPNQTTTASNLLAATAIVTLILPLQTSLYFVIFWSLALMLDMCDGMIARLTGKSSPNGAFYDHMTDQVKLLGLFLAVIFRYQDPGITAMAFLSSTLFLFYSVLHYKQETLEVRIANSPLRSTPKAYETPARLKSGLWKGKWMSAIKAVILFVWTSIFCIHGHTVILLLPLAFGPLAAKVTMMLFIVSVLKNIMNTVKICMTLNRQLYKIKPCIKE